MTTSNVHGIVRHLYGVSLAGCLASLMLGATAVRAQSTFEADLVNLARQSERFGRVQEAGKLYEQVLAANPQNQEAHHRLGVMAASRGDYDRGISSMKVALNCGPPSAQILSDLGGAFYLKGEHDLAEQNLRVALTLDPTNTDAMRNLELATAKQREKAAETARLLAEQRAKDEAEAAHRAHRIALARAAEESQAAIQALANARAAAAARQVAEARAAAEHRATEHAVAEAQFAVKVRQLAEEKAAAARQEAENIKRSSFEETFLPPTYPEVAAGCDVRPNGSSKHSPLVAPDHLFRIESVDGDYSLFSHSEPTATAQPSAAATAAPPTSTERQPTRQNPADNARHYGAAATTAAPPIAREMPQVSPDRVRPQGSIGSALVEPDQLFRLDSDEEADALVSFSDPTSIAQLASNSTPASSSPTDLPGSRQRPVDDAQRGGAAVKTATPATRSAQQSSPDFFDRLSRLFTPKKDRKAN